MQRRTKCSPSFPKETAESAQSYLHTGSGESAPDWKIPLPPMESWSNNVPGHAGIAREPRLPQCTLCLPGSHRGFPKLSNPPNSIMQLVGPARLGGRVLGTTYNQAGSEIGVFWAAAECAVEIPNIPRKVLCISALTWLEVELFPKQVFQACI